VIHEAARAGVIPKTRPWLTKNDYAALSMWLEDPASRPALNDARDRAIQAMVDFNRLGPIERAVAKKILFVWAGCGAARATRSALPQTTRSAPRSPPGWP
jgi:hypothetical protein